MQRISYLILLLLIGASAFAEWPTLRGGVQRTGNHEPAFQQDAQLAPVWSAVFQNGRIGTAVEPIVWDGQVFVPTHQGQLYALDEQSGEPLWVFQANGPILHSPSAAGQRVIVADARGGLYALESKTGELIWMSGPFEGGFSASPMIVDGSIYIGTRGGRLIAVDYETGELQWFDSLQAPIRQTAAYWQGRVYVTAEDLRLRCWQADSGKHLWTSVPFWGQTARDYYPVIFENDEQPYVAVRTNPLLNMSRLIARDRQLLARNAGFDDREWETVEAWTQHDASWGDANDWWEENRAVQFHLLDYPDGQTFFLTKADNGEAMPPVPILWSAGCQGVGTPPVALSSGELIVFGRSAYGNWSRGVAPLVAVGIFQPDEYLFFPLAHQNGKQPPWNTFWGTADETTNVTLLGDELWFTHQDTLSKFGMHSNQLANVAGDRDTWGGYANPPWARNEWHGPGRGSVAQGENRLFWLTGSRLIALGPDASGEANDRLVKPGQLPSSTAPELSLPDFETFRQKLIDEVRIVLRENWAPLYVEPGLARRDFYFDHSAERFAALAWAYPHLPPGEQENVLDDLGQQWQDHFPLSSEAYYGLQSGQRREAFRTPRAYLERVVQDKLHPFAHMTAIFLYAQRCGQWNRVEADWTRLTEGWQDFQASGFAWQPEGTRHQTRYASALLAFEQLAQRFGDEALQTQIAQERKRAMDAMTEWWKNTAESLEAPTFETVAELDRYRSEGHDPLFDSVGEHRAELTLFQGMSPALGKRLAAKVPKAAQKVWQWFETMAPTWHLVMEERQVHAGENFIDPPDFPLAGWQAAYALEQASPPQLATWVDIPASEADLYWITKLGMLLDQQPPG